MFHRVIGKPAVFRYTFYVWIFFFKNLPSVPVDAAAFGPVFSGCHVDSDNILAPIVESKYQNIFHTGPWQSHCLYSPHRFFQTPTIYCFEKLVGKCLGYNTFGWHVRWLARKKSSTVPLPSGKKCLWLLRSESSSF